MSQFAARLGDMTAHGSPLAAGPGSPNVLIGYAPAWRGMPLAMAGALQAAQTAADLAMRAAEAATAAATGPAAPVAKAAEETLKTKLLADMGALVAALSGGADIHTCPLPVPIPPHGPGVVIDGSPTVMINGLPACRMGDTVLEALGGADKIALGCGTVLIGGGGGGAVVHAARAQVFRFGEGFLDGLIEWVEEQFASLFGEPKPPVKLTPFERAMLLTEARGRGDDHDRALVAMELAKLPEHILRKIEDEGIKIVACRGSVVDAIPEYSGEHPRGWPAGAVWDDVPGVGQGPWYDSNIVVIATTGHGTSEGAHVPRSGEGHGSENVVIHETMHALDRAGLPDGNRDSEFREAAEADSASLPEYEKHPEEAYAESAARYYSGKPEDEKEHPALHEYWEDDPLKD